MDLQTRIVSRVGEFLMFAVTPPRQSTPPERAEEIVDVSGGSTACGLTVFVLDDIDDESDRNPEERPPPFTPTMAGRPARPDGRRDVSDPVVRLRS